MSHDFDEADVILKCLDCGAEIWSDEDRAFLTGPETALCFQCSEARGGIYDDVDDLWIVAPDVSGLPDERRPHP